MGCDIHLVLERKFKGVGNWIGVLSTDIGSKGRHRVARRDYSLFANLAGVRGKPVREQGGRWRNFLPHDASDLTMQQCAYYGSDGHSHSHMSYDEFKNIWTNTVASSEDFRHESLDYDLFGLDLSSDYEASDNEHEFRVVFWFDN